MGLRGGKHQESKQLELAWEAKGETLKVSASDETPMAIGRNDAPGNHNANLMERIVAADNIRAAIQRVKRNKGSAGVDGMKTDVLSEHWEQQGIVIREQLLEGTYLPYPILQKMIPKAGGGERELGIPTTIDRVIQ